ncbi:hypothetical protein [Cohaesibacter intestini]|uniref:hypothetical protein n=1 Tax=Cohaesibacter intestini TaxID=2211145 RepID=UPI0013004053|nr:hypothetical protein [Cohaesibacter intestini]
MKQSHDEKQRGIRLGHMANAANPKLARRSIRLEMALIHRTELIKPNGLTRADLGSAAKPGAAKRQHIDFGFQPLTDGQAYSRSGNKGPLEHSGARRHNDIEIFGRVIANARSLGSGRKERECAENCDYRDTFPHGGLGFHVNSPVLVMANNHIRVARPEINQVLNHATRKPVNNFKNTAIFMVSRKNGMAFSNLGTSRRIVHGAVSWKTNQLITYTQQQSDNRCRNNISLDLFL